MKMKWYGTRTTRDEEAGKESRKPYPFSQAEDDCRNMVDVYAGPMPPDFEPDEPENDEPEAPEEKPSKQELRCARREARKAEKEAEKANRRKPSMGRVYAGPAPQPENPSAASMCGVYAGPAPQPAPRPAKRPNPSEMRCVYAGPDYFERLSQIEDEKKKKQDEEAQRMLLAAQQVDQSAMMLVYGGPTMMGPQNPVEKNADEETAGAPTDSPFMQAVYGGPDYFNPSSNNPPPMPFMCVYAGPDYFNPRPRPEIDIISDRQFHPGPVKQFDDVEPGPDECKCSVCGYVTLSQKFCPNCGFPLPPREKPASEENNNPTEA